MTERYVGIDLGAETVKLVELVREGGRLRVARQVLAEHHKDPAAVVPRLLAELGWHGLRGAAATGRASRMLSLPRVPTKAALAWGAAHLFPEVDPVTIVSIGNHGFSVLELRGRGEAGHSVYRENSRCSQGTGNFLRQLVERFDLTVEAASALCEDVAKPAALSGRCPVILKTDMTHLANKGESRAAILAGLYDAVCENVQVLVKPAISPPDVVLTGGVTRSKRVRENFRRFLEARGMRLVDAEPEAALFLEAVGAALVAAEQTEALPALDAVLLSSHTQGFERVPGLDAALSKVRRMTRPPMPPLGTERRAVLGFDIGSTGSKALALDAASAETLWEGYLNTLGDPVGAARRLAEMFVAETRGHLHVVAVGATGSGREIAGSLLASCFGGERVFVLNEIAAHAAGALHYDAEVDTIFEIGGQDAKYIRLDGGRICDAAMNEACSAGTGSFIAEQGGKFEEVQDIAHMGKMAMEAKHGISLGQHCSVFMAEIIDEAVAAGVPQAPILAGIYDSVIQNYLNRVKGNRSVGQKIFCQGMPFMADALAAAVARQTGREVVVPPNPGTIGALGIALLARAELPLVDVAPLDLSRFLSATVERKDTFVCRATKGCGSPGNKCRIDRLYTRLNSDAGGETQKFLWGGHCSLYDAGSTRRHKLPDLTPDPFRQRRELLDTLIAQVSEKTGRPVVALSDEFMLKGLLPFFATFVRALGFDVQVNAGAGHKTLKRGIESASVPWCAPMQLFHGVLAEMVADAPDYVLVPRLRELPRQKGEVHACTCPIVQAAPDIARKMVPANGRTRLLTARIDMGPGDYHSERFQETTRGLARELGVDSQNVWTAAWRAGRRAQGDFDRSLQRLGRAALAFAAKHELVPVVVLGRAYTLHNDVLNSNVPNLLREQGALAIPVECYPIGPSVPVFNDLYWGYSQNNLRAAHQVRRTDGVYAVFCSNYSCGPDSFNLHFFSYVMENKPFAVIETDGHAGDAGTKTRIEAFLYCVEADRRTRLHDREARRRNNFKAIEVDKISIGDARRREERVLVPRMGPSGEVAAALLRSEGLRAECLPLPDRDALRQGRRQTSGKECVPLIITTGSLLQRLEADRQGDERFAFFMPTACGPCRFGVYNLLHKIILERTGWKDRVRIISPSDQDYFAEMSTDFRLRALVGFVAGDLLLTALQDVSPVETRPGAAQAIYDRYFACLVDLCARSRGRPVVRALGELGHGMFGVRDLLRRAAAEFRAVKDFERNVPTVAVVGEIYARLDAFTNDYVVEKLQARGLRAMMSPFHEWLEYTTYTEVQRIKEKRALEGDGLAAARFTFALEVGVMDRLYDVMAGPLGWAPRTRVEDSVQAAAPYISAELMGEALLTLGGPVHEFGHAAIDGVVAVGPHECMPNKIAEAQFAHVGEERGLISLTLALNGDPLDPEVLDRFAFEVKERHARRLAETGDARKSRRPTDVGSLARGLQTKALMKALKVLTPLPGLFGG